MIEMNSSDFRTHHGKGSMFDPILTKLQTAEEPAVGKILVEECPAGVKYQTVRSFLIHRNLWMKGYKCASKEGKVYMLRYNASDPTFQKDEEEAK